MPRNPNFESTPIITEQYPDWIEPLRPHQINAKFMRIFQFYVLNTPCEKSSWGRKSMSDYGWINYWQSSKFRSLIYEKAELKELKQCESATELARKWQENDSFYFSECEFAYYVIAGEESPLMNLFHRIRNSIAHGRFRMNGDYFFFEDVDKDGTKVQARICLKASTLNNWMQIIKCETDEGKKLQELMSKNRKKFEQNSNLE